MKESLLVSFVVVHGTCSTLGLIALLPLFLISFHGASGQIQRRPNTCKFTSVSRFPRRFAAVLSNLHLSFIFAPFGSFPGSFVVLLITGKSDSSTALSLKGSATKITPCLPSFAPHVSSAGFRRSRLPKSMDGLERWQAASFGPAPTPWRCPLHWRWRGIRPV